MKNRIIGICVISLVSTTACSQLSSNISPSNISSEHGFSISKSARKVMSVLGELGPFFRLSTNFILPRIGNTILVNGNYLYAVGGQYKKQGSSFDTNTVERATISPDGAIGPFSTVAGVTLRTPRNYHTSAVIGNNYYVIGGASNFIARASVERAAINADGTIGNFSDTTVTLSTARWGLASVIIGNYLYVIGGAGTNNSPLSTVERAPINTDGTLGNFSIVPTVALNTARNAHTAQVIGNYLYVVGGYSSAGTRLASVERAPINADGSLGTFVTVPGVALNTARDGHMSTVIGSNLYILGGFNTAYLSSVERAPINSDGTIGSFSTVSPMSAAHWHGKCTVIGDKFYVLGGWSTVYQGVGYNVFEVAAIQ